MLVEEVEVAEVVQAIEETKAKVVELYQLEFNEYTSQDGGTVKAHIWKVQGGLVYMELENGRLVKLPLTIFSQQSQEVLRTVKPKSLGLIEATTRYNRHRNSNRWFLFIRVLPLRFLGNRSSLSAEC